MALHACSALVPTAPAPVSLPGGAPGCRQPIHFRQSAQPAVLRSESARHPAAAPYELYQQAVRDSSTDRATASPGAIDLSYAGLSLCSSSCTPPASRAEQEFTVNFGRAVRHIRQDIPAVLERAGNLDIYAENVRFEDNLSPRLGMAPINACGKEAYSRLMWSVRFHAMLFLSQSKVEVLRMWQRDERTLAVRWSVRAAPRLLNGVMGGLLHLDGISEFQFNDKGLVTLHRVDAVDWSGLPFMPKLARQRSGYLATPTC